MDDYSKEALDDYMQLSQDLAELLENILEYVDNNLDSHPILEPIDQMYIKFLGLENIPPISIGEYKRLYVLDDSSKNDDKNQLNIDDI